MTDLSINQIMQKGEPEPLGSHLKDNGVNFAVFAGNATGVDLVVFDANGSTELACYPLQRHPSGVWHGLLTGATVGTVYGLRASGPYAPSQGHRYQPDQLLLDPYAREIVGDVVWPGPTLADAVSPPDNAALRPKARVVSDDDFDWQGDRPPGVPMSHTVLYEMHVKGFSRLHPLIPEQEQGCYAGVASVPAIEHYQRLGITAVNLLPVHYHVDELHLVQQGKVNYWGYNTLSFFAAEPRYASSDPRTEFREMVRKLHRAGIEVIIDVVFNHTAEGNEEGLTLSLRGLDNAGYYWLTPNNVHYENFTGCGNAVNLTQPFARAMVLDSLRYWVEQMHVDGFRFDLATVLARTDRGFDPQSQFLTELANDPVLAHVKLIAEPWDIGLGGYQLGQFPAPWSEWNDQYRQTMRSYWLHNGERASLAQALSGSRDTFSGDNRSAQSSVNYLCAHDGFTLHDLTAYNEKHNEANGESNRDGNNANQSWNCGVEGESDLLGVRALRDRLQRAMLASLFFSRGVPMLMAGDEMGRTQRGNNNAYCQDNELSWLQWAQTDAALTDFVSGLIALRQEFEQFRTEQWPSKSTDGDLTEKTSIKWINANGHALQEHDWHEDDPLLAMLSAGAKPLLVIFNPAPQDRNFVLPTGRWQLLLNTALRDPFGTTRNSVSIHEESFNAIGRAVIAFEGV